MKNILLKLMLLVILLLHAACSNIAGKLTSDNLNSSHNNKNFLESGQITLSFPIKALEIETTKNNVSQFEASESEFSNHKYAPVVGLLPIAASFNPADNEVWIEIQKESNSIKVYRGQEVVRSFVGEGEISIAPGEYLLQHKQKDPLWYAPDMYFNKRKLRVPAKGDNFRYRRGALGSYALYPTDQFIIHSGPVWLEEIGGIKVSESDLGAIFTLVSVGTPIIIK